MKKFTAFLLLLALLTLTITAFADDFGYYNYDTGWIWCVAGVVDKDIYHHDGRDEMIEYHYAKLSPEAYRFMHDLVFGYGTPIDDYDDNNEIMIYTSDSSINLDDYIGERIAFTGDAFEAMTIYHRRSIVVEVTEILDESVQIYPPAIDDYVDYLELIGLSPDDIINMYGEPGEREENIAEGEPYLEFIYRSASISFAIDDNGDWAVDGVSACRPCAIRMGDVYVSMDIKDARQALEKNGYYLEMTDSEGCSFYTNEFAAGGFCLVMVWEEDGLVSEISGWQGKTAEQLFAAGGGV